MIEYEFRPARMGELNAVEEIVTEAYQPWASALGFRPPPMDADYTDLIESGQVYVAVRGEVDGIVVLAPEEDCLLIENVAVRRRLQGQGVGRALLAYAEQEAIRRGLLVLRLHTHERMRSNIDLYLALGYVETGRQPVPVGHLVHLRKAIAPPD